MSTARQTPTPAPTTPTHDQRIADLEARTVALESLFVALAADVLALAQRNRQIAGHTETAVQYLAALRERATTSAQ